MAHYIPYEKAKNFANHRCHSATITVTNLDHSAIDDHMSHSNGGWTYSWNNHKSELTVFSTDQEALTYVSMLAE